MSRTKSRAEDIIDAGNIAYEYGSRAVYFIKQNDAASAETFARKAVRAAVCAISLVRPVRCCSATHHRGENCATFGASLSQVEVQS